jgi:hypothetical protein
MHKGPFNDWTVECKNMLITQMKQLLAGKLESKQRKRQKSGKQEQSKKILHLQH